MATDKRSSPVAGETFCESRTRAGLCCGTRERVVVGPSMRPRRSVSYTHLTLPTIYSV